MILLACATPIAVAQSERRYTQTPAGSQVEEVLVTGEHPGPGMWKVTKGDNSLWILGTHSPLPQRLRWRSQDVEFAISEAQQVLGNYSASFTMPGGNPLSMKGKPLRRLLPRRAYSQWQSLKKKYIGRNAEIETALPVTAALVLRSNAYAEAGLASADSVLYELHRLANSYQVPVTNDHQVTKVIAGLPADADAERKGVEFLIATMKNLESDLKTARTRANAWAIGDIEALRAQAAADTTTAQLYASSWPYLSDRELAALTAETDARWLAAADRALRRNQTSVATLPIFMLLRPDG
ncbi:MAG TPA: TraB/GumN family protein, partial [Steroidobacteraceae bacterium]|nr:TraB/GumN family protein [Steroidobacteraceae bacterium]